MAIESFTPHIAMPKLIITNPDGTTVKYGLNGRNFTVGRSENNDIVLPGGSSSNHHAVLKQSDAGDFVITDLDSTNKTRVNQSVIQTSILRDGDALMFGDIQAMYESEFTPAPKVDQPTQIYETQRPEPSQPRATPGRQAPGVHNPLPGRQPFPVARAAPGQGGGGQMYTATDGCFAIFVLAGLSLLSFAGGAWAHHSQDHQGQDLITWIRSVMAERQLAEKPADPARQP